MGNYWRFLLSRWENQIKASLKTGGLLVCAFGLVGCSQETSLPYEKTEYNRKVFDNPVATFCGSNCQGCNFDVETCKGLLAKNLITICDNRTKNCYITWLKYADDCIKLCGPCTKAANSTSEVSNFL